ncbi:hypothetical protein FRX31_004805, partial [Thalictrum thalictroides]
AVYNCIFHDLVIRIQVYSVRTNRLQPFFRRVLLEPFLVKFIKYAPFPIVLFSGDCIFILIKHTFTFFNTMSLAI